MRPQGWPQNILAVIRDSTLIVKPIDDYLMQWFKGLF